jgi:long-chain acyl-CoA synthetase
VPNTTITIRDDNETILSTGQVGEICIAGPQVMKGYWQRPEETAKVMTQGRLLQDGRHRRHGRARLRARSSIARRT